MKRFVSYGCAKSCVFGILFLFIVVGAKAQKLFVQQQPELPQVIVEFEALTNGNFVSGDIDSDGDQDVILSGLDFNDFRKTIVYRKTPDGNFIADSSIQLEGLYAGGSLLFDADGDEDLDYFAFGYDSNNDLQTFLYWNDGGGDYTLDSSNSFSGMHDGGVDFGDIDGDGDFDLFLTGVLENDSYSRLLVNDGNGVFSESVNQPFTNLQNSRVRFFDVDGDQDLDILQTGIYFSTTQQGTTIFTGEVFSNDGNGNFTLLHDNQLPGLRNGFISLGDLNGDTNIDLALSGTAESSVVSRIYTNDGSGSFTEVLDVPFKDGVGANIALIDSDQDDDLDIFISPNTSEPELYINDGNAGFSLASDIGFPRFGSLPRTTFVFDFDEDEIQDLLFLGEPTVLYKNGGDQTFLKITGSNFTGVGRSAADVSDVDGDGDLDFVYNGQMQGSTNYLGLAINDGTGSFQLTSPDVFPENLRQVGQILFDDVDGDGDQDLYMQGLATGGRTAKLYFNNGDGDFSESDQPFVSKDFGNAAFADIDGQNGPDLITVGIANGGFGSSDVYLNDGLGNFSLSATHGLPDLDFGTIHHADIDSDNDNDVILSARNFPTTIYLNDGTGQFTEDTRSNFPSVGDREGGAIISGDVDGDNDLDIFIIGGDFICELYLNDGEGVFTLDPSNSFTGLSLADAKFSDLDQDSDIDIVLSGRNEGTGGNNFPVTEIYLNDGQGLFSLSGMGNQIDQVDWGTIDVFDANGDQVPDIFITGFETNFGSIAKLFFNVDPAPEFLSNASYSVAENSTGIFADVDATNGEGGANDEGINYQLSGGADASSFSIDESSGLLSFVAAPDFENPTDADTDNVYELQVTANDGVNDVVELITVTITDENDETPTFTSSNTTTIDENSAAVLTLTASDADANATLTFSLNAGADQDAFSLSDSDLSFVNAPNFDDPSDSNQDNIYEVTIEVSDGLNNSMQMIEVTVSDLNEAPAFTSAATVFVIENSTEVLTLAATDEDANTSLDFSLAGGVDESQFSLNGSELSFNTAPVFDAPVDANADNVYEVSVEVSDGTNVVSQQLQITVEELLSFVDDPRLQLKVYPNPGGNDLVVESAEVRPLQIMDMNGKKVLAGSTNETLDVSGLQEGLYLVRVQIDGEQVTVKFKKQ